MDTRRADTINPSDRSNKLGPYARTAARRVQDAGPEASGGCPPFNGETLAAGQPVERMGQGTPAQKDAVTACETRTDGTINRRCAPVGQPANRRQFHMLEKSS